MYFTVTSEAKHEKKEDVNEDAKRPLCCLYCVPAVYFPQNVLISAVKRPTRQSVGPPKIVKLPRSSRLRATPLCTQMCVSFEVQTDWKKSLRQRQVNVKVS